jgi:hypothetical protein
MRQVGFEPMTPSFERQTIRASDGEATVFGSYVCTED